MCVCVCVCVWRGGGGGREREGGGVGGEFQAPKLYIRHSITLIYIFVVRCKRNGAWYDHYNHGIGLV